MSVTTSAYDFTIEFDSKKVKNRSYFDNIPESRVIIIKFGADGFCFNYLDDTIGYILYEHFCYYEIGKADADKNMFRLRIFYDKIRFRDEKLNYCNRDRSTDLIARFHAPDYVRITTTFDKLTEYAAELRARKCGLDKPCPFL